MTKTDLDGLKLEISIKAKNGIDFILAATITWSIIAYVWTLPTTPYNQGVLTFIAGGVMIPLALLLSKLLKTQWKIKNNPLQPLGLWLNFAQLFYFPFLIFILIKSPLYFAMTYAIITGAHLFAYAWFYNEKVYGFIAGIAAFGSMIIALMVSGKNMFLVPAFMVVNLFTLALVLYLSYSVKNKKLVQQAAAGDEL